MNIVYPPRRILFPIDFSERCVAMAPTVAAFVRHYHASLTLLHVVPEGTPDEERIRIREDLNTFAWPHFSRTTACQAIATGDAASQIIDVIHEMKIDLVMMPTHGYGAFQRFLLGSVVSEVLHKASCPVLTDVNSEAIPRPAERSLPDGHIHFRRVLCAVDLSPCGRSTLRWARDFAEGTGAELVIAHAIPLTVPLSGPDAPLLDWTPSMVAAARESIEKLKAEEGIQAPVEIVTGEVEYAVHDLAVEKGADILVIGRQSGGRHEGFRAHTYPIVRHSPCPVISICQ